MFRPVYDKNDIFPQPSPLAQPMDFMVLLGPWTWRPLTVLSLLEDVDFMTLLFSRFFFSIYVCDYMYIPMNFNDIFLLLSFV